MNQFLIKLTIVAFCCLIGCGCAPSEDKLISEFKLRIQSGDLPQALIIVDKAKLNSYDMLYDELNKTINKVRSIIDKKEHIEFISDFKTKTTKICNEFKSNPSIDSDENKNGIVTLNKQYLEKISQTFTVEFISQQIPLIYIQDICKKEINADSQNKIKLLNNLISEEKEKRKQLAIRNAEKDFNKSVGEDYTWYEGDETITQFGDKWREYNIRDTGRSHYFGLKLQPYIGVGENRNSIARMKILFSQHDDIGYDTFKAKKIIFKLGDNRVTFNSTRADDDLDWKGSSEMHFADVLLEKTEYENFIDSNSLTEILVDTGEIHLVLSGIPSDTLDELKRTYSLIKVFE